MATQGESLNAGLTRTQVAHLLEISDREVARMDGRQLHPSRASNRSWVYDPTEVRGLLMNAATAQSADVGGEVTAAAFAMFWARKSLPKVVVALKLPAHVVLHLRAQYDQMRGSLSLGAATLSELKRLLNEPGLRAGADVIKATQRALEAKLEEGRLDATEFGVVMDEATGKMMPVVPRDSRHATDEPKNASAATESADAKVGTPGAGESPAKPADSSSVDGSRDDQSGSKSN